MIRHTKTTVGARAIMASLCRPSGDVILPPAADVSASLVSRVLQPQLAREGDAIAVREHALDAAPPAAWITRCHATQPWPKEHSDAFVICLWFGHCDSLSRATVTSVCTFQCVASLFLQNV